MDLFQAKVSRKSGAFGASAFSPSPSSNVFFLGIVIEGDDGESDGYRHGGRRRLPRIEEDSKQTMLVSVSCKSLPMHRQIDSTSCVTGAGMR
jgi:hypothetical protein